MTVTETPVVTHCPQKFSGQLDSSERLSTTREARCAQSIIDQFISHELHSSQDTASIETRAFRVFCSVLSRYPGVEVINGHIAHKIKQLSSCVYDLLVYHNKDSLGLLLQSISNIERVDPEEIRKNIHFLTAIWKNVFLNPSGIIIPALRQLVFDECERTCLPFSVCIYAVLNRVFTSLMKQTLDTKGEALFTFTQDMLQLQKRAQYSGNNLKECLWIREILVTHYSDTVSKLVSFFIDHEFTPEQKAKLQSICPSYEKQCGYDFLQECMGDEGNMFTTSLAYAVFQKLSTT